MVISNTARLTVHEFILLLRKKYDPYPNTIYADVYRERINQSVYSPLPIDVSNIYDPFCLKYNMYLPFYFDDIYLKVQNPSKNE